MNSYPYYNPFPKQQNKRHTQHDKVEPHIIVEGRGKVTVKPDLVSMQFGVITEDQSATTAQQQNALQSTQLIRSLIELGIDKNDIETMAYNVFPKYKTVDNESILEGFKVTHQLKITVRNSHMSGEIYDVAFQNGASSAGRLSFELSDPDPYYLQALQAAVNHAIRKAAVIAETIHAQINQAPTKIKELGHPPYRTFSEDQPLMSTTITPTTSILPREISITAEIEAQFDYKN
ncbi:SIMPL domain-containing protein [Cytobacillus sp. IB215316]|uniref:SIMPL domain-containing protein n=1 Tax=Cytobacillus sp. IB215316 TaxID=3097354 RepID=UPI002A13771F|nr:SIMPL domain-containing protein [Cytobacillus sp. IB215316]MDX8360818.1 SIMPL domain-containing protein [Cytobacillus sp. IB215316]